MTDATLPLCHFRVVQTLGDGIDEKHGGLRAEDKRYAVVVVYPQHPGWWRVVAEFYSLARAEGYACIENDTFAGVVADDYARDLAQVAPSPEPRQPATRVTPDNLAGEHGTFAHEADMEGLRADQAEDRVREVERQLAELQEAISRLTLERGELVARAEKAEAAAELVKTTLRKRIVEASESSTSRAPAQLDKRQVSVLRAFERLRRKGDVAPSQTSVARESDLSGGSIWLLMDGLVKTGYLRKDGAGRKILVRRADGTLVDPEPEPVPESMPAEPPPEVPEVAVIEVAIALLEPAEAPQDVPSDVGGDAPPEAVEVAPAPPNKPAAASELEPEPEPEPYRGAPPLKVGPLPSKKPFNNPFAEALADRERRNAIDRYIAEKGVTQVRPGYAEASQHAVSDAEAKQRIADLRLEEPKPRGSGW